MTPTPSELKSESRQEFRKRLLAWLRAELPEDQAGRLYYHLGDLHEAFRKAMDIIEELPRIEAGEAELRKALSALSGELREHIPQHLEEVKPDLDAWRDRVYEQAEKEGTL
jgi:hypothetical protein